VISFYHGRGCGCGLLFVSVCVKKTGRVKNTHPCEGVRAGRGEGFDPETSG
jgi:hypothetical protein